MNYNAVCFFEVIDFIIFQSSKITVITPGEALAATIHNELLLAAPNLLLFELFSCLARKFSFPLLFRLQTHAKCSSCLIWMRVSMTGERRI